ncbi:winged helix-turn-helix domain-containing protein [Celeribacter litoreus]|uniref:winged helix-turn-helix domain-containing protein n=1 Tax=Celeribacter litoreus TaxID=2876714 RepID=UPI001CCB70C6|nr:helix-turn-helix domain-containing protein [Celeribacter litoreus]MCA0041951.1 helix-turn-helix domain-containing protein [Celeribacter litoreus]
MLATISSDTDSRKIRRRIVWGLISLVVILLVSAGFLFRNLPDANKFNERVEQLFVESDLTSSTEIAALEILAQSGTAFSETLNSYLMVIFVLVLFSIAVLVTALVFLFTVIAANRRLAEVEKRGIEITSLMISRAENAVYLNNMAFQLTPAAIETLSVLAEARMDEETLSGAEIEAMISGKLAADCDEASGATRIKRLRDALGNQMVSELLVKNIARKGYMLACPPDVIRMD